MFSEWIMEIVIFLHGYAFSEADEIYKICSVIGSPTMESWADGLKLARDINYQFPQVTFFYLAYLVGNLVNPLIVVPEGNLGIT